jgi:putative ABC transport system permease protein
MALPISYHYRNVFTRWRSTLATILGIATVVFVYVAMQSMAAGIKKIGANTGDPRNLLVTRTGATAESTSQVTLDQFKTLKYSPELARDPSGEPVISGDLTVIVNIPRIGGEGNANAIVRGVSPQGKALRPQVKLVAGRWFAPGQREVVASVRLSKKFADLGIGQVFRAGGNGLTVVGHFDGEKSAFDSELWMDADETRQIFDRSNYSSLLVRPRDTEAAKAFALRIENDKRFKLRATPETEYYSKQTQSAESFKMLGKFLATAMSVGAIFAAMNTMYALVGARTREVGTLRVLGYRRRAILSGFLIEGALLATLGGVLGCLSVWALTTYLTTAGIAFGTFSSDTFSESVFELKITARLVAEGMVFSVAVGLLGSLLPSLRAARIPVISALKSI